MKQFRLIKTYPGNNLPINTIVKPVTDNFTLYQTLTTPRQYVIKSHLEDNPEFWEEIIEYPIGTKVYNQQTGVTYIKKEDGWYKPMEKTAYTDEMITTKKHLVLLGREENKIVEKDYKILSVINPLRDNCEIYENLSARYTFEYKLKKHPHLLIKSVKRLSDGEVFTVGDKTTSVGIIESFEITPCNNLCVNGKKVCDDIEYIKHSKQPLFTTEDGVDLYVGDKYVWINSLNNCPGFKKWEIVTNENCIIKDFFNGYFREGVIVFSTKEKAQEYLNSLKPKPLFTTHDGVEIYEGDECWAGLIYRRSFSDYVYRKWNGNAKGLIYFANKENLITHLNSLNAEVIKEPKVVEKEFEVLSLIYKDNITLCFLDKNGDFKYERNLGNNDVGSTLKSCLNNNWRIYSIKRLSDGQIFTVGDKITYSQGCESIKSFEIALNSIRFNFENGRGILLKCFSKSIEIIKQKPVKQETVLTSIYNKIISFRNNTGTGATYTYNRNTDKYHSDKSSAQVPFDECMKRYPLLSVINTERNILVIGNMVCRTDVNSETEYEILEFGKKKNNLFAKLRSYNQAIRYVDIDNLEHFV